MIFYSLLTTELCLFISPILMHTHVHTCVEHTHTPCQFFPPCQPWLPPPWNTLQTFSQILTTLPANTGNFSLTASIHHSLPLLWILIRLSWDIPWLVAWSEFLHCSVFNRPWPHRPPSTWPFCLNDPIAHHFPLILFSVFRSGGPSF